MSGATTGGAADEFNLLMSRNISGRLRSHPADARNATPRRSSSSSSSGSTTLAPSSVRTSSTITQRSSQRTRLSVNSRSSLNRPRPISCGSFFNDSDSEPETPEDNHDSSESDGERNDANKGPSKYYLPQQWDRGAMTGPKGVIADAAAFELEKAGQGSKDYHRTKDLTLPRAQRFGGSTSPPRRSSAKGDRSGSASEGMSEEDDRAMQAYREKRMAEIQQAKQAKQAAFHRPTTERDRRGMIPLVNPCGFLEAVERAGRGCVTVVLITDDEVGGHYYITLVMANITRQNDVSAVYSRHLYMLSKNYPSHKFVALSWVDASIDYAACPALLAYKNGEQFAQIMPLQHAVPPTGDVARKLEDYLRRKDVLGSRFDIDGF